MAQAYPILLDISDRRIVIIGGGAVAARKAGGLLACGAKNITCVSPSFCEDIPAGVQRIAGVYADKHLDGAHLIFACTDNPDVNSAIVRDARARKLLINRADIDDANPGDFSTPARLEQGGVIIVVSASSPALSSRIRDDLADKLDRRFVKMADVMRILRGEIRASLPDIEARAKLFRDLAGDDALYVLDTGGIDKLRLWIRQRHPELNHE